MLTANFTWWQEGEGVLITFIVKDLTFGDYDFNNYPNITIKEIRIGHTGPANKITTQY